MKLRDMNATQERDALVLAEARIRQLAVGAEIQVKFTSRYWRKARVTRIGRGEIRFIQTWVEASRSWSNERKLTAYDLVP